MSQNCAEVEKLLSAYIDQELTPAEARAVASHLALCASCQKDRAELERVKGIMGSVAKPKAPPELTDRIVEAALRPRLSSPAAWRWMVGSGLALAAGILVTSLSMFFRPKPIPLADRVAEHERVSASLASWSRGEP